MEALRSFETWILFCPITWPYIRQDGNTVTVIRIHKIQHQLGSQVKPKSVKLFYHIIKPNCRKQYSGRNRPESRLWPIYAWNVQYLLYVNAGRKYCNPPSLHRQCHLSCTINDSHFRLYSTATYQQLIVLRPSNSDFIRIFYQLRKSYLLSHNPQYRQLPQ
jgi:hypothetical protein